jgi:hypothetical protein
MARQPGLRLAQDFSEFHHAERPGGGQRQKPQAGRFGGGAQGGQKLVHRLKMT